MSVDAVAWALRKAPVLNAQEHVLLIALADRADERGRAAWPYQEDLAAAGRCSVRTARRHLAAMEGRGLIRRGDQRIVSHLRADHRPIVWDLDLSMRLSKPVPVGDLSDSDERPDNLAARSDLDILTTDERGDKMTGRTNDVSDARDDRPDNMTDRTELCPNDRTELCPPIRPLRPSSSNHLGGVTHVARASDDEPPAPHCVNHPGGTPDPCGACASARKRWVAWNLERDQRAAEESAERIERERRVTRQAAADRAAAIGNCNLCDSHGYAGMTLCAHDPGEADRAKRGRALVDAALRKSAS